MSCGDLNFLEGGTIKDSNIVGGTVVGTDVKDSKISGAEVVNLRSIDTASTERITEAMGNLSTLNTPLVALIARSLSMYGLVDDAFLNAVMKALDELPEIKPAVAQKILDAISNLSPASIATAIQAWSSETTAKAYAECLRKLTTVDKTAHMTEMITTDVVSNIAQAIAGLPSETRRNLASGYIDEGVANIIAEAIANLPAARLNELVANTMTEQMASSIISAMGNIPLTQLEDLARNIFTVDVVKIIAEQFTRLPADTLKPLADMLYQITHHGCVPMPYPSACPCNSSEEHECGCTCGSYASTVPLSPQEPAPCPCCDPDNAGNNGTTDPTGLDGGELP